MNRRAFLALAGAFAAGCAAPSGNPALSTSQTRTFNAGPSAQYIADGVYSRFRDLGFFIVRQGPNLFALSSTCTYRKCTLASVHDKLVCPCHDSTFSPNGNVLTGPAHRDLPTFPTALDDKGSLLVTLPA